MRGIYSFLGTLALPFALTVFLAVAAKCAMDRAAVAGQSLDKALQTQQQR